MSNKTVTPFDNIESAHEYVALLAETIEETRLDIETQINLAITENATRRKEALQLVSYNLSKLSLHMTVSRRILNDLRSLRCLLLGERMTVERKAASSGLKARALKVSDRHI